MNALVLQRALAVALAPARRIDPVFPTYIAVQLQKAIEQNAPMGAPRLVVDEIKGSANHPPVTVAIRDVDNGQRYSVTIEVMPCQAS